jgi:hypothetical protein
LDMLNTPQELVSAVSWLATDMRKAAAPVETAAL